MFSNLALRPMIVIACATPMPNASRTLNERNILCRATHSRRTRHGSRRTQRFRQILLRQTKTFFQKDFGCAANTCWMCTQPERGWMLSGAIPNDLCSWLRSDTNRFAPIAFSIFSICALSELRDFEWPPREFQYKYIYYRTCQWSDNSI